MIDDVTLNKAAILERCLRRITEEYQGNPSRLLDFTYQDAIVLNLERACQAAIDLAMYIVAKDRLGVPQSSSHAFQLLADARRIPSELPARLRAMVGFRNIAIHGYQNLNLEILRHIVEYSKSDLINFCQVLGLKISP